MCNTLKFTSGLINGASAQIQISHTILLFHMTEILYLFILTYSKQTEINIFSKTKMIITQELVCQMFYHFYEWLSGCGTSKTRSSDSRFNQREGKVNG